MNGETKAGSWTQFNDEFDAAYLEQDIDTLIRIVQKKATIKAREVIEIGAVSREDVAADIVIKVYRYLPSYDPTRGKPSTFVNSIAQSVIKNCYRDNAHYLDTIRKSVEVGKHSDHLPSQSSTLDLLEVEFEMFARTLTEKEQQVAKLRIEGYTNVEIAEKLDISKQRVGVIVEQIRTKFQSA